MMTALSARGMFVAWLMTRLGLFSCRLMVSECWELVGFVTGVHLRLRFVHV
jgi:hypothetical protein